MSLRSTSIRSIGQAASTVSTTGCSAIMLTVHITLVRLPIMIHGIIGTGHSMTHGTGICLGVGVGAGVASTGVIHGATTLGGILTTMLHATTGRMLITTTTISTMEDIIVDIISTDCLTGTTDIWQADQCRA